MTWKAKERITGWCVVFEIDGHELAWTYANGFGKIGAIGYPQGTTLDTARLREVANKVREEFVGATRFGVSYSGARMLISQHIAEALNEAGIIPCA